MPTVHRFGGLRVVIYRNDHRPAHVHVIGNGCEAVFVLNGVGGLPELRENYGFAAKDLGAIRQELATRMKQLQAEWSAIHGN